MGTQKGSPWTEKEKIALLLSITTSFSPSSRSLNWKDIALPEGRTLGSSRKIYNELKSVGAGVKMVKGHDIAPTQPMGPRRHRIAQAIQVDSEEDDEIVTASSKVRASATSNSTPASRAARGTASRTHVMGVEKRRRPAQREGEQDSDNERLVESGAKRLKSGAMAALPSSGGRVAASTATKQTAEAIEIESESSDDTVIKPEPVTEQEAAFV